MKNEDWYTTGGYFKNGLFVSISVISGKYKRATKNPDISTRKRGLRERGGRYPQRTLFIVNIDI